MSDLSPVASDRQGAEMDADLQRRFGGLDRLFGVTPAVSMRSACLAVVGIGGVTADNYREVRAAGADGAAIVSGILAQPDIRATVRAIAKISQEFAK